MRRKRRERREEGSVNLDENRKEIERRGETGEEVRRVSLKNQEEPLGVTVTHNIDTVS